jgi:hypothetical protein
MVNDELGKILAKNQPFIGPKFAFEWDHQAEIR